MPPVTGRSERQEPPFCVQIELTEGCNLRCNFCGLNGIRGRDNDLKFMTVDTAGVIVDRLVSAGWLSRIEFAMHGEPTLNPQAAEIVRLFRRLLPSQHLMMTSNGGGLLKDTRRRVSELLESLNVLALDWYENVTIVPRVLESLGKDLVIPRFYPQDANANPHRRRRTNEHELVVIQDIELATTGTHATLNNHAGCGAPRNDRAVGKRCAKPFRELSIRWNGSVAVCCNDWRGEYRCGDVLLETIEQVWQSPAFRAARRRLYYGMRDFGPCAGCDALSYRTGLLPDHKGLGSVPPPTNEDALAIAKALGQGPFTLPVLRPWELEG